MFHFLREKTALVRFPNTAGSSAILAQSKTQSLLYNTMELFNYFFIHMIGCLQLTQEYFTYTRAIFIMVGKKNRQRSEVTHDHPQVAKRPSNVWLGRTLAWAGLEHTATAVAGGFRVIALCTLLAHKLTRAGDIWIYDSCTHILTTLAI